MPTDPGPVPWRSAILTNHGIIVLSLIMILGGVLHVLLLQLVPNVLARTPTAGWQNVEAGNGVSHHSSSASVRRCRDHLFGGVACGSHSSGANPVGAAAGTWV